MNQKEIQIYALLIKKKPVQSEWQMFICLNEGTVIKENF